MLIRQPGTGKSDKISQMVGKGGNPVLKKSVLLMGIIDCIP